MGIKNKNITNFFILNRLCRNLIKTKLSFFLIFISAHLYAQKQYDPILNLWEKTNNSYFALMNTCPSVNLYSQYFLFEKKNVKNSALAISLPFNNHSFSLYIEKFFYPNKIISQTFISGSYAYILKLNKTNKLATSLSFNYSVLNFDPNKLIFSSMIDILTKNITPSPEIINIKKISKVAFPLKPL